MKNTRKANTKFTAVITAMLMAALAVLSAVMPMTAYAEDVPAGYTPIHNIEELYAVRNDLEGKYILMNDIDMTEDTAPGGDWDINGTGWEPIGDYNNRFDGEFDGNGHAIIGMNIHGEPQYECIGLFGNNQGTIKNLKMLDVDININSNSDGIGSICGYIGSGGYHGRVGLCFATGTISVEGDSARIGGIAGLHEGALVDSCYSTISINCTIADKNTSLVGGVVGDATRLDYLINNCYYAGKITSNSQEKGAIVGYNYTSGCKYCYYLNGACEGQESISGKFMGLSVAQMKSQGAFTNWDFDNTWVIDSTSGYKYPQLRSCMQVPVTSVTLAEAPTKTTYNKGEKLDLSGGKIAVYHKSDETTGELALAENMLGEYSMELVGKQEIPVTFIDKSTSFEITVNPSTVENLKVSEVTEESASLSWDKVTGVSGYYVYKRKTDKDEWKQCGKVTKTGFTDKEENLDTEFMYAVSSYLSVDGIEYISDKVIVKKPVDFTLAEVIIDDIPYDEILSEMESYTVKPQVLYNGKLLKEGTDYNITDGDFEVDFPGEYTLTLSGAGDYAGTVTVTFYVICDSHELENGTWGKCEICGKVPNPVDMSKVKIETYDFAPPFENTEDYDNLDINYFYDSIGSITYNGYTLERDNDYTIAEDKIVRENRFGKCTFTLEGTGAFKGETTANFTIYCMHAYLYDHKNETVCKFCGACSGDVSGNDKIDLQDVIAVAQSLIGTKQFTSKERYIADFNRDGRVDLQDAIAIAKYLSKKK